MPPPRHPIRLVRRTHGRAPVAVAAVLMCLAALVGCQLLRALPAAAVSGPRVLARTLPGTAAPLPWPASGQASVMIDGYGTTSSPSQRPVPTASTAKVMTAYVFLRHHPLRSGGQGPTFTVSAAEASRYPARVANGESLTPVTAGEHFTERRALRAMLTVSANNIADEVARWCSGSRAAFVSEMNRTARGLGMHSTTYTDPAGLDPATVSTPADQVRLFAAALKLPGFAEVAGAPAYTEPSGARHANSNPLLGRKGVFAGKTGTTSAAGKNLVLAARRDIAGTSRLVVVALMAQPLFSPTALPGAAVALLTAADRTLTTAVVVRRGDTVAHLDDGLGHTQPLRAARDIIATGRRGATVTITITPGPRLAPGTAVGSPAARAVAAGSPAGRSPVSLVTTAPLPHPSLLSRLTRTR
ncbi:serine hydrolase [Streptomyces sp. NPDC001228]|uniref:D-alanyl-D-alanine carboxypeptidase family protein n=1 Tax=Streptomyces sp. NPDC001228 TaxID=3154381 RepID=UPI00331C493E